jgi:hypothetical protein
VGFGDARQFGRLLEGEALMLASGTQTISDGRERRSGSNCHKGNIRPRCLTGNASCGDLTGPKRKRTSARVADLPTAAAAQDGVDDFAGVQEDLTARLDTLRTGQDDPAKPADIIPIKPQEQQALPEGSADPTGAT